MCFVEVLNLVHTLVNVHITYTPTIKNWQLNLIHVYFRE